MKTLESLAQTVEDVKVEVVPKSLFVLQETPQVCYNKAILKKYLSPKRWKHTYGGKNNDKTKKI